MKQRTFWFRALLGIIALGVTSRLLNTGWIVFDKYLGDALYAAMVYALLNLVWQAAAPRKAVHSMLLMTALEVFQLTRIPARLLESNYVGLRILAILLGTEFSGLDLLAYAVGILGVCLLDIRN